MSCQKVNNSQEVLKCILVTALQKEVAIIFFSLEL